MLQDFVSGLLIIIVLSFVVRLFLPKQLSSNQRICWESIFSFLLFAVTVLMRKDTDNPSELGLTGPFLAALALVPVRILLFKLRGKTKQEHELSEKYWDERTSTDSSSANQVKPAVKSSEGKDPWIE